MSEKVKLILFWIFVLFVLAGVFGKAYYSVLSNFIIAPVNSVLENY